MYTYPNASLKQLFLVIKPFIYCYFSRSILFKTAIFFVPQMFLWFLYVFIITKVWIKQLCLEKNPRNWVLQIVYYAVYKINNLTISIMSISVFIAIVIYKYPFWDKENDWSHKGSFKRLLSFPLGQIITSLVLHFYLLSYKNIQGYTNNPVSWFIIFHWFQRPPTQIVRVPCYEFLFFWKTR